MTDYASIIKKNTRIYTESLRDDIKARKDKDFFRPTGTQVYVGRQGSGKTTAMVYHILDLKKRYPKAILVTNIQLSYYEKIDWTNKMDLLQISEGIDPSQQYILFQDMQELALVLTNINNGKYGVIYAVDEIHTYFNALESANIPPYVFTEISQQRKQRKLILGSSQLFMRMAKPFREQCDNLIICRTIFGIFTLVKAYDGMTLTQDYDGTLHGTKKKSGFFIHNRKIRNAFDTYQKVVSGQLQLEESQNVIGIDKKKGLFSMKK